MKVKEMISKSDVTTLVRRKKLYKTDFNMDYFNSWLAETVIVKAYCLFGDNGCLLSIALMSKCEYDPLDRQTNPMIINYIYTLPQQRRKGYGSILLNHMKSREEFTAFTCSPESEGIFSKNGCLEIDITGPFINKMYRWGPNM